MDARAASSARAPDASGSFRHELFFYGGESGFLDGALPYVRTGLAADDNVMVAVDQDQIESLRSGLGRDAGKVTFADVTVVGRNPAAIIPMWRDFVDQSSGRTCRGLCAPAWPSRSAAALVECRNHEALVDVAFGEGPAWNLLCLFDESTLPERVIADARATHQYVVNGDMSHPNSAFELGTPGWLGRDDPLTAPPASTRRLDFGRRSLGDVRLAVEDHALAVGLSAARTADFVLAMNELVGNSVRHGGGGGELRLWSEGDTVVGEVSDRGTITDPLAGRRRPTPEQDGGRGLWIVNQVCDLLEIRSEPGATVVRAHVGR
jgi:anti-sigma regulatory factor (Ser/Thr protein kinase)